jgi:chromosomal replication initiator protein
MHPAGTALPTVAEIKRAVAAEFEIDVAAMSEPYRAGLNVCTTASRPRQLAIALSALMTRHSKARIGFFFGQRDHSTVFHARRAVNARLRSDPELRAKAMNVLRELRRG